MQLVVGVGFRRGSRRADDGPASENLTSGYRSILLAYASTRDDPALDEAIALAVEHNARLTILVPVASPSRFVHLAHVDAEILRDELLAEAEVLARGACARVPRDVSVTTRCVPREAERLIALDISHGRYDLYVNGHGRRDPGALWGSAGCRLGRLAAAHGVARPR